MWKSLKVKNWKSFEEATLYFDPVTLLIGTNASGKSNLVEALLFVQRLASGISVAEALNGNQSLPAIRGGTDLAARKPGHQFSLEFTFSNIKEFDFQYTIQVTIEPLQQIKIKEELVIIYLQTKKSSLIFSGDWHDRSLLGFTSLSQKSSQNFSQLLSQIFPKIPSQMFPEASHTNLSQDQIHAFFQIVSWPFSEACSAISLIDPIPQHMRQYSALSETLQRDAANLAGVLEALPEPRKAEVMDILTRYFKELPEGEIVRLWTESVGRFGKDAMLYCEERWSAQGDSHIVDLHGMSDGSLRFLAILTALLTGKPESLLIIEEIDNGLHPHRARVLVEVLQKLSRQQKIDVLATTHNPALLDALGPEMIPFITVAHRDPQSGSSHLTLLEELEELPRLLALGSVGQLATQGKLEGALKRRTSPPTKEA